MGRRLTGLHNGIADIYYTYDASGQRVSKTVNGVTTKFYYDDRGALILMSSEDGTELYFYPDADGSIGSFKYKNVQYYYVRNAQNDVIGITDKTGEIVARYTYDEWGNTTSITDADGNRIVGAHVAHVNPLRYRSYFYDAETGWYWLNTRYYDPAVGRFINADGALYYGIIYNLYSYCYNNPIVFCDCKGNCAHNSPGLGDCRDCLAGITPDEEEYHQEDIPTSFENDNSTIVPFGITHSLGQGWHYMIHRNSSGEHIHIFNNKSSKGSYSQNRDGTPHDKSNNLQSDPPKWIKELLKKAGWDWDGNKNNPNGGSDGDNSNDNSNNNSNNNNVNNMVALGTMAGLGYITYRLIRLIPSFLPPLWGTLPANFIIA